MSGRVGDLSPKQKEALAKVSLAPARATMAGCSSGGGGGPVKGLGEPSQAGMTPEGEPGQV